MKMKKSVSMGLKKDEGGFTMISLLLTIVMIAVTMPIIIFLIQHLTVKPNDNHIIAHQFFTFLYHDTLTAENVEIVNNKIYFTLNDHETASIEQYENLIRRRVLGKGHEIYIREIDTFNVFPETFGYRVNLKMTNGEEYEKTIAYNH